MAPDNGEEPSPSEKRDRAQDAAERRQHERAESVDSLFADVQDDLGTLEYPVTSEELSTYYADDPIELPNETESLGSAFGRLDRSFEDPDEAYEALVSEFDEGRLEGWDDEEATEDPTWDESQATDRRAADSDTPEREDESEMER